MQRHLLPEKDQWSLRELESRLKKMESEHDANCGSIGTESDGVGC